MKSASRVVLAVLVAGAAFACAPRREDPDSMIAAARELDQRFVEAYSRGDVEGVMATYWGSPDLVSFPPGDLEERGYETVRAGLSKAFEASPGGRLELIDPTYHVFGDVVVSWGKWRFTTRQDSAPPIEITGRFTDVKAKRDGKWVYIHDHASVPMAPAAPDTTASK